MEDIGGDCRLTLGDNATQLGGANGKFMRTLGWIKSEDCPPQRTPNACEECLAEGTVWVALRECHTCGHLGCCDSSTGKHATKHFHETHHPVMRARPAGGLDMVLCS